MNDRASPGSAQGLIQQRLQPLLPGVLTILLAAGCTPTIQVAAPSEPIEINLNVTIQHEIRIKVDKDLEELFEEEADIF